MTTNRTCICCGKKFYFCDTCKSSEKNTGVSMVFDTEECKELSNAISGYSMKMWDKSKIKSVLEKYNITDYAKYKESVQGLLNELFQTNDTSDDCEPKHISKQYALSSIVTQNEQNENSIPAEDMSFDDKPRRKHRSRKKKVDLAKETVEHSASE